jgi:hypothetical protein
MSYSHKDSALAQTIHAVLEGLGLDPVMDWHIAVGTPFTDAIKGMISRAHIFMPILTADAKERPWVHQEIGYAMALKIPVLPLAVGEVPPAMIAQLQAVCVSENADAEALESALKDVPYENVVMAASPHVDAFQEVADWTETRTRLMAESATRVISLKKYGMLRQRASLSSFSIPDADLKDPIWEQREGRRRRSEYLHYLQRQERRALEVIAREAGCDLIIDPTIRLLKYGRYARRAYLECLIKFLRGCLVNPPKGSIRVVLASAGAIRGNLTIVGDWFTAESLAHGQEGYRQTLFNWHAPSVLRRIDSFDREFSDLREAEGQVGPEVGAVVKRLEEILQDLPSPPAAPKPVTTPTAKSRSRSSSPR